MKPGSRLVRAWGGETHDVLVVEGGYEWRGQRWTSLSKIRFLYGCSNGPVGIARCFSMANWNRSRPWLTDKGSAGHTSLLSFGLRSSRL